MDDNVIRVLLKVSSPALRAGLRALLSSDPTIKVAAAPDALDEDDLRSEADVIVTSASLSAASSFHHGPDAPSSAALLLLGDDRLSVQEMRRAYRVWGVLPSDSSPEELTAAIHALAQGLIVGAPALLFHEEHEEDEAQEPGPLTDREGEVLGLLARGLANKQIAVALGISEHTVKFHVSSIYQKLNVTNRTEAVRAGLRGGWIAL